MKKILLLLVGLLGLQFCNKDYKFSSNQVKDNIVFSGARSSSYGQRPFPYPDVWAEGIKEINRNFNHNTVPAALWIVGVLGEDSRDCRLEFPVLNKYDNITSNKYDKHEKYLSRFDSIGVKVFLQVEPAMANVDTLIKLVLDRYGHHPSVIGFGVDAEWYKYTKQEDWGVPIKDIEAKRWEKSVKDYDPGYQLFLKHWDRNWMPETYRGNIIFVSDSQMFRNRQQMVTEFTEYWGPYFYPNTVFYQIGYPADKTLWNSLDNPIKEWGATLANGHQQNVGIFWVDFTLQDVVKSFEETGEYIIGTKIYDSTDDFNSLFRELKEARINTLVSSQNLNANPEFRLQAEKYGMKRFLIFPVFYAPDYLKDYPDHFAVQQSGDIAKDEWVTFACPSRNDFRQLRIDQLKEIVAKTSPDGISIDFIRHFAFWEKIYPDRKPESFPNTCFCHHCMKKFQAHIDTRINAETLMQYYQWILDHKKKEWINWKSSLITSMVKELVEAAKSIDPEILINIHLVPWQTDDFDNAREFVLGQNIKELAKYADYLSPMTYAHMVKQNPEWIAEVVWDIYETTNCKILPSFQVSNCYREEEIPADTFQKYLHYSSLFPTAGYVYWSWEQLSEQQKQIIME